ncbi:MAG: signal recognition particle protein [Planctomycetota bacterium]|nr:MAG: signal recognition particle protein [Planctomycetota bacterium]
MFDSLSDSFQGAFDRLFSGGKLTAQNIDEGLREVRKALLEADVSVSVVKEFIANVKESAVGQLQVEGVDPSQQIVKIVSDELVRLMGPIDTRIKINNERPTVIMMVGLQGSGKTTTTGKLAKYLVEKKKKKPLLVAADLQRPAAIEQLHVLGESLGVPVYSEQPGEKKKGLTGLFSRQTRAAEVCRNGIKHAENSGRNVVILDTAGRLHIDDELMKELEDVKKLTKPDNIFLVCDAMTGQDAVHSAKQFNDRMAIDGVILTKLDGDTRGGAALSIKAVTGKTIKFIGTGEKLDRLEEFHPERMASRILGMGDIVTLVEKAQEVVSQKEAEKSATRLISGKWNFEDFLGQLQAVKKMGPLKQLLGMIPGMGSMLKQVEFTGDELKPVEAIINSMTRKERRNPELLSGRTGGSRRRRIARGSGTTVQEVNLIVKQFKAMKRMMGELGRVGDLGSLMTPGGIENALPQLPGGKALLRARSRGPKPKRNKNKNKRKNKRKRARR